MNTQTNNQDKQTNKLARAYNLIKELDPKLSASEALQLAGALLIAFEQDSSKTH